MELIHSNKENAQYSLLHSSNENCNNDVIDTEKDVNIVIRLGEELQRRIGILPKVENYTLMLPNVPGKLIQMLCVKPKSYTEISRTVRAARTMKLTVRACGEQSAYNLFVYGNNGTVLIDCTQLADSPRLEFTTVKRKDTTNTTEKEINGLKILSCVTIQELIDYQISHNIEISQTIETCSIWGTVVGALTSTQPGLVGPGGSALGGCLTDEVIAIRIVDCHGDLIEYTDENAVKAAVSNLGLLGVVYDVTLRYSSITLSKVNYRFCKWSDILDNEKTILKDAIINDQSIELIYLPYNSCRTISDKQLSNPQTTTVDEGAGKINDNDVVSDEEDDDDGDENVQLDLKSWNNEQDEVLIRTTQRLSSYNSNSKPGDPNTPAATVDDNKENTDPMLIYESEPKEFVYLLDQVFGPLVSEFIEQPSNTPKLLKRAHKYLKYKYCPKPTVIQYTPWALNSFGKFKDPFRILKFTMETDYDLNRFILAVYTILDVLYKLTGDQLLSTGGSNNNNFSVNLGLRIQFTRGTKNGYLMGIGLEDDNELQHSDRQQLLLAHITFMGLTSPGPNTLWNDAASQITMTMLTKIPTCMPQWKTEWHTKELLFNKFREALKEQAEPLKKLIAIADRDGMFLNEHLASILYDKLTFYQNLYRSQRDNYLLTI
ncbi:unnamed protein product [Trichobilharzia szidati]|nr:unnamed protein product [Trichobilharzia szidati]